MSTDDKSKRNESINIGERAQLRENSTLSLPRCLQGYNPVRAKVLVFATVTILCSHSLEAHGALTAFLITMNRQAFPALQDPCPLAASSYRGSLALGVVGLSLAHVRGPRATHRVCAKALCYLPFKNRGCLTPVAKASTESG